MRVFVALQLPDKTRQNLSRSAETLRHFDKGGKFVPAANYHITLSFLGEVADDDLIYVQAAMDKVAHMTAPTMAVSQISVLRASDIVCAKFRYDKALTELHEALAEELESRRFTVEHRAYRPPRNAGTQAQIHLAVQRGKQKRGRVQHAIRRRQNGAVRQQPRRRHTRLHAAVHRNARRYKSIEVAKKTLDELTLNTAQTAKPPQSAT